MFVISGYLFLIAYYGGEGQMYYYLNSKVNSKLITIYMFVLLLNVDSIAITTQLFPACRKGYNA